MTVDGSKSRPHIRVEVFQARAAEEAASGGEVAAAARGDRARLRFLLELSHELRTPAGIISGYLNLAREGAIPLDQAVEVAGAQAENLVALIDALLEVAEENLRSHDDWKRRMRIATLEAEQLCARAAASIAAAHALLDGVALQHGADPGVRVRAPRPALQTRETPSRTDGAWEAQRLPGQR
jgi:signal transduction histidine kinase